MIDFLRRMIALFSALLLGFGVYADPSTADPVVAESPETVLLQTALLADSQILANYKTHWVFKADLEDIENNAENIDALVLAGDLTESGDDLTNEVVINMLRELSIKKKIIAAGNHDVRLNYSHTINRFIDDVNTLGCADYEVDKPYYYTVVNGYYFIVLGTERQELEKAYISDTQLRFLDNTLKKATADGKPAFVINHQPLANTHGLPGIWKTGDIGKQSSAVAEILKKYDNVFFITGHLHSGFGATTYESLDNVHLVSVPNCAREGSRQFEDAGTGIMMEVYSDRVVFRARNFSKGEYMGAEHPDFDCTVELV